MRKEKKIKIFLGLTYILIIISFLWAFFDKFSLSEFTSYEFIKNNIDYLNQLKNKNFLIISLLFFIFTVLWVLLLGFGSPILLLSGFIFGKWFGFIYAVLGLSLGATLLYIFANYFLKDLVEEKFSKKFSNLNEKFKKNEFIFFIIYRFVGGIPFQIQNILPVLFNVKLKNYFFGSVLGMTPQIFVGATLGAGINEIIQKNIEVPSLIDLLFSREIYVPIIAFVILIIIGIIIKNIFYKN
tara:strand:+ start:450 stop:1169 length:720 start_codon:yes stop_codon:yes gene_type:complete